MYASPRNNQNHKLTVTSTFLSSNGKRDFCYPMANISPSHVQQCLNLTMHFSHRHLAAKILSPLSHNFISFLYFFPSYETCSINVNCLFHASIKNYHKNISTSYFSLSSIYLTTLSEDINMRKNTFLRQKYRPYPPAKRWILPKKTKKKKNTIIST